MAMFGIGNTNMLWRVAPLTGVVLEKTTSWGQKLIPYMVMNLIALWVTAFSVPVIV